jgi:nucleoside phosphorylase
MNPQTVHVIKLLAPIGDHIPRLTDTEIEAAIAPARPALPMSILDLGDVLTDTAGVKWERACCRIQEILGANFLVDNDLPLAIFGFAPIPLLISFGRVLGDKSAAQVFERHSHTDSWRWDNEDTDLTWRINRPGIPRPATDVVVLLSVSGSVKPADIPTAIRDTTPVYELTVDSPQRNIVRTKKHLQDFVVKWRELLNEIRGQHGSNATIHLLPAAPLSISVECGRRLLPKVDPTIRVYDWRDNRFQYAISVGARGVWREAVAESWESCDLLVLVALEEEFEELYQLFPDMEAVPDPEHGGSDFIFTIRGSDQPVRTVARLVGGMGIAEAQLAADRALTRWRPSLIVNIGIAASLHDDIKLGDVLVADQVDAYDANLKAVSTEEGGWELQHRGAVFHGDHLLLQMVKQFRFTHRKQYEAWRNQGASLLDKSVPKYKASELKNIGVLYEHPTLHVGHLASGSVVGAATGFTTFLKSRDATIRVLEMEAAGMTRAAVKRTQQVPWLIIRGVSDFGDERKSEMDATGVGSLRRMAMLNAINIMLSLVRNGMLKSQAKQQPR